MSWVQCADRDWTDHEEDADLPILSGLPLLKAKEHLLSCLLQRPKGWPQLECTGLSRHHFRDRREWQQAFDLMLTGQDHIRAFVVENPTSEIARLYRGGTWLRTEQALPLVRQIVASVRAEEAAGSSNKALEPTDRGSSEVEAPNPETARAKAEMAVPETEKVSPETANEPVASTELSLDYASVLQQHMPLLLDLDRLITVAQKRFDSIPAQIAFERQCLPLESDNVPSNVVEGEFKEIPAVRDADHAPSAAQSSSVIQAVIGSAPASASITEAAGMFSTLGLPGPATSAPLSVELGLPDAEHDDPNEAVDLACTQLQYTDQTQAGERSTEVTPAGMVQTTADDLVSSGASAANAGAVHADNMDALRKLS
jgi:hypothetical protein